MAERMQDGRRIRILTVIDLSSRECLALVAARSITGQRVANELEAITQRRQAKPEAIRVDNGTEFCSKALDQWADARGVGQEFLRPGTPVDHGHIESFNGRLRDELLNTELFFSIADTQVKLDGWKDDYNTRRPHGSLANLPPAAFAQRTVASPPQQTIRRLLTRSF